MVVEGLEEEAGGRWQIDTPCDLMRWERWTCCQTSDLLLYRCRMGAISKSRLHEIPPLFNRAGYDRRCLVAVHLKSRSSISKLCPGISRICTALLRSSHSLLL